MLDMYVIYESPSDYPGKFVVRKHVVQNGRITPADSPEIICDNLAKAREAIPPYLYRQPREMRDDRCIVETWF